MMRKYEVDVGGTTQVIEATNRATAVARALRKFNGGERIGDYIRIGVERIE